MALTDPGAGKFDRVVSRVSRSPTAQTAFALELLLDYAGVREKADFARPLTAKARQFYLGDKNAPLAYESGLPPGDPR